MSEIIECIELAEKLGAPKEYMDYLYGCLSDAEDLDREYSLDHSVD